ncbi:MAG: MATE family efflux transporter [Treponemataceae bacterium]|nr:MATE family efflux transporter [Treponemataceae bacterium]
MKVGIKNTVDLTEGSIPQKLFLFALPLVVGNLLQQFYNIVDTIVVGKYLGENALAAVGSAYTIMILLTSIIIGLCMGASVCFSMRFGQKDCSGIRQAFFISFIWILIVTVALHALSYALLDMLIKLMNIPEEIRAMFRQYMLVIFSGIFAVFLYNIFSNLFRAVGNSVIPLAFLALSTLINVVLDLVFIIHCKWRVVGAATATVIAQYISGIGITIYYFIFGGSLRIRKFDLKWDRAIFKEISRLSSMTCVQQSIMNFGILMVQGLVNSFGTAVMPAFAAGVKIDTLAYSPVQDFGNAFSSFVAQNYGAQKKELVRKGVRTAVLMIVCFCAVISVVVCLFANQLMKIFIDAENVMVIAIGVKYLRIEGACYVGIGLLFMLYGYFRAINKPAMSIVLTIISLGVRVALSYILVCCTNIGEISIWMAIPIGWLLADVTGIVYGFVLNKKEAFANNRI